MVVKSESLVVTMFWRNLLMGLNLSRWAKGTTKRTKNLRKRKSKKMLTLQPMMDRLEHEVAVQRDRLIRLHSVQTDIALDLPPSITLPDGEEYPYGSSTRLKLRDPDQESEIYRKCIKAPPNRTIYDRASPPPPPYRSSSTVLIPSDWSSGSSSSVIRSHSVSNSSSKRPTNILGRTVRCLSGKRSCPHPKNEESTAPSERGSSKPSSISVLVPSHRCRRLSAFSKKAGPGSDLASVPTVRCITPATNSASDVRLSSGSSADNQSHSMNSGANLCENPKKDNKAKSKCDRSTF